MQQRGGAAGGLEHVGEGVPHGRGGSWGQQAVAVQRGRVGTGGAASPQAPVQQPELGVQQVGPVQVTVDGFPTGNRAGGTDPIEPFGDLRLGPVPALCGEVRQRVDAVAEPVPPRVRQVEFLVECVLVRAGPAGQVGHEFGALVADTGDLPLVGVEHVGFAEPGDDVGLGVADPPLTSGPLGLFGDHPQPAPSFRALCRGADGQQSPAVHRLAGEHKAEVLGGVVEVLPHPGGEPPVGLGYLEVGRAHVSSMWRR